MDAGQSFPLLTQRKSRAELSTHPTKTHVHRAIISLLSLQETARAPGGRRRACVRPGRSTRNTRPGGGGGGSGEPGTGGGAAGCPGAGFQPPSARSTVARMSAASKSPARARARAQPQPCEHAGHGWRAPSLSRPLHAPARSGTFTRGIMHTGIAPGVAAMPAALDRAGTRSAILRAAQ